VIRAAEKQGAVARMNLEQIEKLERHAHEQLRWEGDQDVQRSMKRATWVTAIVASAALIVSARSASRPPLLPPPVRVEGVQPVRPPLGPGPWRPELLSR
jgi:hypothetical protein